MRKLGNRLPRLDGGWRTGVLPPTHALDHPTDEDLSAGAPAKSHGWGTVLCSARQSYGDLSSPPTSFGRDGGGAVD
jgi:hypothetical protein